MSPKPRLEKNRIGLRLKLLLVVVLAMLMMWAMLALFLVGPDWLGLNDFKSSGFKFNSLLLAALITALLMVLLVWLFDAVFLLRLERLSADVARVADAGDRSSRVKNLSGKDELTGLAMVKAIGIDYAQGYAVAEPVLFDDSYFIASRDLD
ncbi:hypothetical protein MCECM63_00988 [Methylophilaceae bacterium]|jgi:methyl-accepting chemotaxis protein